MIWGFDDTRADEDSASILGKLGFYPSMTTIHRFIYITTSDDAEARHIGESLVSERLAACVNILGPVHSIYRWEGKVEQGSETVLIAKTTEDLVEPLIDLVQSLHSYDCPCIVVLPIDKGFPPYLDWIAGATR